MPLKMLWKATTENEDKALTEDMLSTISPKQEIYIQRVLRCLDAKQALSGQAKLLHAHTHHKNYYMSLMRKRQPFYQKDIHNSTFYHNHRYFAERERSQNSFDSANGAAGCNLHREFVKLPQPFGVDFTYKYLRKANINCIPDWAGQTRIRSNRQSRGVVTSPMAPYVRMSSQVTKTQPNE